VVRTRILQSRKGGIRGRTFILVKFRSMGVVVAVEG
jgi:hypothetical protein